MRPRPPASKKSNTPQSRRSALGGHRLASRSRLSAPLHTYKNVYAPRRRCTRGPAAGDTGAAHQLATPAQRMKRPPATCRREPLRVTRRAQEGELRTERTTQGTARTDHRRSGSFRAAPLRKRCIATEVTDRSKPRDKSDNKRHHISKNRRSASPSAAPCQRQSVSPIADRSMKIPLGRIGTRCAYIPLHVRCRTAAEGPKQLGPHGT